MPRSQGPFPTDIPPGGDITFQTPNGSASYEGQRPVVGIGGERSKNAPNVRKPPGTWPGNRTGE